VVLFALMFVWTPPHFWALAIRYRDDYRSANVPMMPVVTTFKRTAAQIFGYSVLVAAVSLVFAGTARMGPLYWITATILGTIFCVLAFRLWRDPTEARAMRLFHWSITYVTLLFAGMAIDQLAFP
jgi:protoheme IX farnesyltransferase